MSLFFIIDREHLVVFGYKLFQFLSLFCAYNSSCHLKQLTLLLDAYFKLDCLDERAYLTVCFICLTSFQGLELGHDLRSDTTMALEYKTSRLTQIFTFGSHLAQSFSDGHIFFCLVRCLTQIIIEVIG